MNTSFPNMGEPDFGGVLAEMEELRLGTEVARLKAMLADGDVAGAAAFAEQFGPVTQTLWTSRSSVQRPVVPPVPQAIRRAAAAETRRSNPQVVVSVDELQRRRERKKQLELFDGNDDGD